MFFKIFFTIATVAIAVQANDDTCKTSVEAKQKKCSGNQEVHCCNNAGGAGNDSAGLSAAHCVKVPLLNIPIGNQCGGNNIIACCDSGSHNIDLINISCLPINLIL